MSVAQLHAEITALLKADTASARRWVCDHPDCGGLPRGLAPLLRSCLPRSHCRHGAWGDRDYGAGSTGSSGSTRTWILCVRLSMSAVARMICPMSSATVHSATSAPSSSSRHA